MVHPWLLDQAKQILDQGGLVACPTEAVYGLGVRPDIPHAVRRLFRLKQRNPAKGLIVVACRIDQVTHYICDSPAINWSEVIKTWPGPVTWVFPATHHTPKWLTGGKRSIAIRISDHPVLQALCRVAGPLISTSANPGARRPARTAQQVRNYFGNRVDLVIPGKPGGLRKPTEIRDSISGTVIRAG